MLTLDKIKAGERYYTWFLTDSKNAAQIVVKVERVNRKTVRILGERKGAKSRRIDLEYFLNNYYEIDWEEDFGD